MFPAFAKRLLKIEGHDNEGWPHFVQLKSLPKYNMIEQENFLKDHILIYFENADILFY